MIIKSLQELEHENRVLFAALEQVVAEKAELKQKITALEHQLEQLSKVLDMDSDKEGRGSV